MSKVKIFAAMMLALITVLTFEPAVFLAGTPAPNPQIMADLGLIPSRYWANLKNPLDRDKVRSEIETAKIVRQSQPDVDLSYTPVSTGVFAAENISTGKQYVKLEKGTKAEVHIMRLSDGKIVKVYVPVMQ